MGCCPISLRCAVSGTRLSRRTMSSMTSLKKHATANSGNETGAIVWWGSINADLSGSNSRRGRSWVMLLRQKLGLFVGEAVDLLDQELLDRRAEPADGGGFEEEAQGDLEAQGVVDVGGELNGEDRVRPHVEEVVVAADRPAPQEVLPDAGDELLDLGLQIAAGLGRGRQLAGREAGAQGAAVHLAARSERQGVDEREVGGHHIRPQDAAQRAADSVR